MRRGEGREGWIGGGMKRGKRDEEREEGSLGKREIKKIRDTRMWSSSWSGVEMAGDLLRWVTHAP